MTGVQTCALPISVAAFALAAPFIGPFARLFGFVALPLSLLAATLAIIVGYVGATELAKRWFYRVPTLQK